MKRQILLLFLVTLSVAFCAAQKADNWNVEIATGFQPKLSANADKGIVAISSPSKVFVYDYSIRLNKTLLRNDKTRLHLGLGVARKTIQGKIGVNHCYGRELFCARVFVIKQNYTISQLQLPLRLEHELSYNLFASLQVLSSMKFHQNEWIDLEPKFGLVFESIEVFPRISYRFRRVELGLAVRAINVQRKEEIYIYAGDFIHSNTDFFDTKYESDNPLSLALTVNYIL